MCTLSWQIWQGQLSLVFSRDEALDRPIAEPPRQDTATGVLRPTDPQSGGTWLSVNPHGMVLCLLNDYRFRGVGTRRSRGLLVADLSACTSLQDVARQLARQTLTDYAPFQLVVFPGPDTPRLWGWNGEQLTEIVAPASPLSSSSLLPSLSPRLRRWWVRRQTGDNLKRLAPQAHRQMHLTSGPLGRWFGVRMQRRQRATVSLCHLELSHTEARLLYQDLRTNAQHTTGLALQPRPPQQGDGPVHRAQPLDLEAQFQRKNPTLHAALPRLAWPVLRGLLCEARLNRGLDQLNGQHARAFCAHVLDHLGVSLRINADSAPLPEARERPVFLANHPSGGLDGLVLIAWLSQHYPKLKVVVTDALLELPHLAPFAVPVDRYQRNARALRKLHDAFAGEAALLVFPAGRTARRLSGNLVEAPWQKMPVTLARQHRRSVAPLHLEAANSRWFDAVARVRRALGIKLNLEMLWLVRELLNPACTELNVTLGQSEAPDVWIPQGQSDPQRLAYWRGQYDELAARSTSTPSRTEVHP